LPKLYHCHLHVEPIHPSIVNRKCPHPLGDVIMKMIAKNPNDRYDSCDQLRIILADVARPRI
jgi:serine/threonine protein kinase